MCATATWKKAVFAAMPTYPSVKIGETKFGTRTELKNINSFRFVQKAIDYEVERQVDVIESGGRIVQETRLWNSAEERTVSMRSKEEAHDYRYFPDPDLAACWFSIAEWLKSVAKSMPELPEKRARPVRRGICAYRNTTPAF